MIELAIEGFGLKETARTGWLLRGIDNPESVADHSWGTALLCMLYGPAAGIDVSLAVRIAVVHDLAECRTGDIATRVSPGQRVASEEEKRTAELDAMEALAALATARPEAPSADPAVPVDASFRELWQLYEDRATPEAVFVRDMNLIDMCLQALLYEAKGVYDPAKGAENFPDFARLDEFFATSGPRIATEVGRRLYDEIYARYRRVTG